MADLESVVFGNICKAFNISEVPAKKSFLGVSNDEPIEGTTYYVFKLIPDEKRFEGTTTTRCLNAKVLDNNIRLVETENSFYLTMLGGAREGKSYLMASRTIPKAGYRVDGVKLLVNGTWTEWHTTKAIHVYDHNGVYEVETLNSRYYVVVAE